MKKVVKGSKFENKVVLRDAYGNIVCELIEDDSFWVLPKGFAATWLLSPGDEYYVEEYEAEVD